MFLSCFLVAQLYFLVLKIIFAVFTLCDSAHIVSVSVPVSICIELSPHKAQEFPSGLIKFLSYLIFVEVATNP